MRLPLPFVRTVRSRTLANVNSIGLVVRRWSLVALPVDSPANLAASPRETVGLSRPNPIPGVLGIRWRGRTTIYCGSELSLARYLLQ